MIRGFAIVFALFFWQGSVSVLQAVKIDHELARVGQIMAVYTDINEDELTSFLTDYSIGALQSYRGIAEGVENSNFHASYRSRTFHPHFV